MGFLGVYRAIYDYVPQGDGELAIKEADLLYVLEKSSEDDWWKAKRKATEEEDDEPVGLIPSNYVEEVPPLHHARALYDYTRQTDEELSFTEDAELKVYDTTDPDWSLVGTKDEYGFAPANYIEITEKAPEPGPPRAASVSTQDYDQPPTPSSVAESEMQSPAAALAGIMHRKASTSAPPASPPVSTLSSQRPTYTPEASDDEATTPPAPSLPARPSSEAPSTQSPVASPRSPEAPRVVASPPYNRATHSERDVETSISPGRYHLYNINEMVSAMGKQKKMPTTLGVNTATGTIMIAPEKSRDGPQQEWTADKLTHYSIEGKHVFMELIRPSRSIDFHAGAKDTAQEIVSALGEMAGAVRAEGLREVIAAGSGSKSGQKIGQILYDFTAQGEDEVTVVSGDEVIIVDDSRSEEWWMVRRMKTGEEGVVPSSYVEVTGTSSPVSTSRAGINAGRSTVEQNRLEEAKMTREAVKSKRSSGERAGSVSEVGPGMKLPERGSSLMGKRNSQQKARRDSRADKNSPTTTKPKPDSMRTRIWTDRSGSFKVDAEYIGCTDGKIHLHKLNGVKIAVPVVKMSVEDLEYVERISGLSLDEDKPLSDIRRRSQLVMAGKDKTNQSGATIKRPLKSGNNSGKADYDWFDFFLKCGVGVHQCERYAQNFARDSMDETILPEIDPSVLRTLGLKEGDILRVMKHLDTRFGRIGGARAKRNVSFGGAESFAPGDEDDGTPGSPSGPAGGLFSGPGGALRNNTRKGRPAPTVQTSDTVDPKAFSQKPPAKSSRKEADEPDSSTSRPTKAPPPITKDASAFDDDAWDVKPSKQQTTAQTPTASPPRRADTVQPQAQQRQQPQLTGALQELSLLTPPLQPIVTQSTGPPQQQYSQPEQLNFASNTGASQQFTQPQQTSGPSQTIPLQAIPAGATPSFFNQLNSQQSAGQFQQNSAGRNPVPAIDTQQTGLSQIQSQNNNSRQRPQAPPQAPQAQGSLMLPPPPRPLSAPQNVSQPNGFGPPPLQPQLTGIRFQGALQPQIAPPGQSLNEINQQRALQSFAQQSYPQIGGQMQQQNGLLPQPTGQGAYTNNVFPQQTGFSQQQPNQTGFQPGQHYLNGQATGSPFANPGQQQSNVLPTMMTNPTGQQQSFSPQQYMQAQQTGNVNAFLPPALQPQPTGQGNFFNQAPPPVPNMPPIPQAPAMPLLPQKTGPPPPVRFGVTGEAKKLTPQATGRRANLSQATPQNPFGF